MESTSCELALKPSLYNNSPIHNHYSRPGNTPSSAHIQSRPGETPTFRAPGVSPGENTHIPRTSSLARSQSPTSITGVSGAPYQPGLRKPPAQQSMSSLWYRCRSILCTQLGRVSPYGYQVPPPHSGLYQLWYESCRNRLTITLYQQLDEYTVIRVSDQLPSFQNNTIFI